MIEVLVGNDADGGFNLLFTGDAVFLHSAQDILHVGVVQRLAGAQPAHRLYDVDALTQQVQPDGIGKHMVILQNRDEAKVQAAFAQLAKGKTVLMIAHRLSTVANADCIYVVQDGQIVESGTKDELCAQNGLFARMWQEYQASVQWKVAKEG